jgi:hypothetical protein
MGDLIDMRSVRVIREARGLLKSYRDRTEAMSATAITEELGRFREEAARYPDHTLTLVKGEILYGVLLKRDLTRSLRDAAEKDLASISMKIRKKMVDHGRS